MYKTSEVCKGLRISRVILAKAIRSGLIIPRKKRGLKGRKGGINWYSPQDVEKLMDVFYPKRFNNIKDYLRLKDNWSTRRKMLVLKPQKDNGKSVDI